MKNLRSKIVFLIPILAFANTVFAAGNEAQEGSGIPWIWWLAPISALLSLGFAYFFYKKMMTAPEGTEKMIEKRVALRRWEPRQGPLGEVGHARKGLGLNAPRPAV